MNIVLVGILLVLSTAIGFWVSYKFFGSKYAVTDKRGDFHGPSGAVFALTSGLFASIFIFSVSAPLISPINFEVGFAASMGCGLLSGIAGMFCGITK